MEQLHLHLRPYRRTDLDALFRLDEICFEPRFRFTRSVMRRFAEAPEGSTTIAELNREIAGFCIVHYADVDQDREAYVVTLDVAPQHRRAGIATKLMEQAEDEASAVGCSTISLHVYTANAGAIRFYERMGFEFSNRAEHFYGPGVHALIYRKPLAAMAQQQIA